MNPLLQDSGNPSMELALALPLQRSDQAERRADQQGKEIDDL